MSLTEELRTGKCQTCYGCGEVKRTDIDEYPGKDMITQKDLYKQCPDCAGTGKSEKLALLSEMLGIEKQHTSGPEECKVILHKNGTGSDVVCGKCGKNVKNCLPCRYPDPITTDLRILAWQVRDKMGFKSGRAEMFDAWENKVEEYVMSGEELRDETPEDWVEAGIEVYKRSQT